MSVEKKDVIKILHDVKDPDLGFSIVEMGLIYDIIINNETNTIEIVYTLTSPACPVGDLIEKDIIDNLKARTDYNIKATLVWEPAWSPELFSTELKLMYGFPIDLEENN